MSKEYRRKQVYAYFLSLVIFYGLLSFSNCLVWGFFSIMGHFSIGGSEVLCLRHFNFIQFIVGPFLTFLAMTCSRSEIAPGFIEFFFPRVWQEHNAESSCC